MLSDRMKKIKVQVLRLWGKGQRYVEKELGLILALFLLNWFTICYLNLQHYKDQQLGVLLVDGIFVLAGAALYVGLLGLIPARHVRRVLAGLSFFVAALLGGLECFALWNYRAQIGAGIITAVMQTNPQEAGEFFARYVGIWGIVLAVGFLILCAGSWFYLQELRWKYPSGHWRSRLLLALLLAGAGAGGVLFQQYHNFIVNNDLDIPVVRVGLSLDTAMTNMRSYEEIITQAATEPELIRNDSSVPYVVFIVGESTNRRRLHLYGYPLENTPNLDDLYGKGELAVFREVIAPQGATAAVLRELFTFADAENTDTWYKYNNLIDIMKAAGYKTAWLSNQESSGIWGNVSQFYSQRSDLSRYTQIRESHEESGRLDEELFPLVDEALAEAQPGQKQFMVLHLMGGHSLYYLRFPYLFTKFKAEDVPPPQDGLSEEKRTEIAQYENALFYNDFVVSSIIGKFRDKDALVIYLPDHGEAVYDHGYRSGHVEENPTQEMLEVPMVFWGSPEFRQKHGEKWAAIQAAVNQPYMTDDMIHTVMDILDIETLEYDPQKSVINPAFDTSRPRMVQGKDFDKDILGK